MKSKQCCCCAIHSRNHVVVVSFDIYDYLVMLTFCTTFTPLLLSLPYFPTKRYDANGTFAHIQAVATIQTGDEGFKAMEIARAYAGMMDMVERM